MKFQGIVCIITGGAGGLGEATTKRLLELGTKVMIFDLQEPKDELANARMCLANSHVIS